MKSINYKLVSLDRSEVMFEIAKEHENTEYCKKLFYSIKELNDILLGNKENIYFFKLDNCLYINVLCS